MKLEGVNKHLNRLLNKLSKKSLDNYGYDFLQTWDKSKQELEATLIVAEIMRTMFTNNISPKVFNSGISISWFRDKSTRTRYSFKSASNLLGLTVDEIDEERSQITHGETVHETANMISFLTEAFGIRDDIYLGEGHEFMKKVADAVQDGYSRKILNQRPSVINLQCDRDHPTQSLSDLLHLKTHFGGIDKLKGKKVVMSWAYSPSYGKPLSVAQGVCGLMTRFGMNVVLAYPPGYNLIPDIEKLSKKNAKESGGSFKMVHDFKKAFKDADVVYPKSWASYKVMLTRTKMLKEGDQKGLKELEKKALFTNAKYKNWQCTKDLMKVTRGGKALYMHCLPADITGVNCTSGEVSESVFNRYKKETYTQASFKPYIVAAMLMLTRISSPVRLFNKLIKDNVPIRIQVSK